MAKGKRDATAHRVLKSKQPIQDTAKYKKERAQRNAARTLMEKEGKVSKGDGKDVDHKKPLSKGGSNSRSNLKVQSRAKNRGHGMSK